MSPTFEWRGKGLQPRKENRPTIPLQDWQKVADLTRYCGLRRCRYRGLERAEIHTLLATTVCDIKRMVKLLWGKPNSYYLDAPVAA